MPFDSDKRSRRARRGADGAAAPGLAEDAEGGGGAAAAAAAAAGSLRRRPGSLVRLALSAALAVALALAVLRAWRLGRAQRQDAALAPGAAAMAASVKDGTVAGAGAGPGGADGGALRTRAAGAPAAALVQVSFEVFGKVQKVSFRKYAQLEAQRLKLTGFVENTEAKTVRGEVCGPARQVALYQEWLRSKGSPKSRVERVEFGDKRPVSASPFKAFDVAVVLLANGKQWAD
jgi:acylphosphatase